MTLEEKDTYSNTLKAVVDTQIGIQRLTKGSPRVYYLWDDKFGQAPEDVDDYIYILWSLTVDFKSYRTQYATLTFEDTPENNGVVLGYFKDKGSNNYEKSSPVQWGSWSNTWYSLNVLTKYPRDELSVTDITILRNNAKVTLEGIDNTVEVKEANATVTVNPDVYSPRQYSDFLSKNVYSSWDSSVHGQAYTDRTALSKLENDIASETKDGAFSVSTTVVGNELTKEAGVDDLVPDSYGVKEYTVEVVDDYMTIANSQLESGDYEISSFKVRADLYDYIHMPSGWGEKENYALSQDVDIYYKDDTGWNKYGVWRRDPSAGTLFVKDSGDEIIASEGGYYELPSGTLGIKAVATTKSYKISLSLSGNLKLFPTEHVKDRIKYNNPSLYNRATHKVLDCNNILISSKTASDDAILRGINRWFGIEKEVKKTNQTDKSRIKLSYSVNNRGNDDNLNLSLQLGYYDDFYKGIYYDLLPLGVSVDETSIEAKRSACSSTLYDYVNSQVTQEVEFISNWRDSGRTMMIVKVEDRNLDNINTCSWYWNFYYDAYYSYEAMIDYGVELTNSVAFQNGGSFNDNSSSTIPSNDASSCYGGPYIEGKFSQCTDRQLISNLGDNPEQETVYAEVTTIIDDPINAELSSTKKVMAAKDVNYTMETETEQDEIYKYRLRTATAEGSSASNIIVYDVLEDAEPENKNRWEGFFDSVDVTQPILKGADPVIYYSTKKDIKLCEQTSVCPDNDLDNGLVWTNRLDDIADKKDVTAIAVDMRKKTDGTNFSIGEKEAVSVIVNMRAPKGGIVKQYMDSDAVALNESWFSNTLSQNDGSNVSGMTKSQITRVHIKAPDLDINKTSDPETGTAEDRTDLINNTTLDYTINLKNNDDTTYTNVEIEDTIPEGLTIVPEQIQLTSGELVPQEDSEEAESANVVYRIDSNNPNRIIFTIKTLNPLATISIVVPTTLPKYVDRDMTYDNTPQINSIDSEEYIVRGNTTYHEKKAPTMTTNIGARTSTCQEPCRGEMAEEDGLFLPSDEFKNGLTVFDLNLLSNLPVGDYRVETKLMQIEKDGNTTPDTLIATSDKSFSIVNDNGSNHIQIDGGWMQDAPTVFPNLNLSPRSVYVAYAYLYDTTTTPETLVTKLEDKTDKLETIITGNTSHDLTISKAITGDGADANEEFNFSVELKGLTKNKTYTTSLPNVNVVADNSGNATLYNVKLKGGESLTINDLDTLAIYKVQEAASTYFSSYDQTGSESNTSFSQKAYTNQKRYLPLTTNEEQILDETGDISIAFTNHKLAYAMSTLASIALDETKTATEHGLNLSSEEGKSANVKDSVTIDNLVEGNYQLVTGLYNKTTETLTDNILTTAFSVNTDDELVQDGETVDKLTINLPTTDLLPRTTYVVYEAIYQDGNLILAHHNPEDKLQTIIVDNSHYDLTLTKALTGTGANTDDKFDFTLELSGLTPSAEYQTSKEGVSVTAGEDGSATLEVQLGDGDEFTVESLDTLSKYTVEEASSDYIASYTQSSDLETAQFVKADSAQEKANIGLATEEEQILDENGDVTVAFVNHRDKEEIPEEPKPEIITPANPKTQDMKVSTLIIMLGSSLTLIGAGVIRIRTRRTF